MITKSYRIGCSTCNHERGIPTAATVGQLHDLCDQLHQLADTTGQLHSATCEAKARAEEVHDLQQALRAAHLALFDERRALLQIQAENDALRTKHLQAAPRCQPAQTKTCCQLRIMALEAQLHEQAALHTQHAAALQQELQLAHVNSNRHRCVLHY